MIQLVKGTTPVPKLHLSPGGLIGMTAAVNLVYDLTAAVDFLQLS